ncbi:hypothetical protein [Jeotgalibacillus proteolyticus]|uniref:N-acetyltransferase domain-containing protein n=1 Tax=Jeotgalibacillus proteolyticus TaxID=2082395 RepID=A0A2S5GFM4_9BACL|nr:hypothetical protein [Jeotgalibacillus proteolyticus]PPA71704.1 hypothetical protein C4B60_06525 [Jeotgalibacillus proteolyticus]
MRVKDVGYRIGEAFTGKGAANQAFKLAMGKIIEQDRIKELNAKTTECRFSKSTCEKWLSANCG